MTGHARGMAHHFTCGVAALVIAAVLAACGARGAATRESKSASPPSTAPATLSVVEHIPAVAVASGPVGGSMDGGFRVTQGWAFTPTADVEVVDLGYIDPEKDGLFHRHRVGIFDAKTDRLIASARVGPTSVLEGSFRWEPLAEPVLLRAGHAYLIGGEYKDGDEMRDVGAAWAPEVGHSGPGGYLYASTFTAPHEDNAYLGFLAPNFKFRPLPPRSTATADSGPTSPDPDNPSGRLTAWGRVQEIDDVFAHVKRPVTDVKASPHAEDMKLVVAEISLENANAEPRRVSIRTFSARDHEGRTYAPANATSASLGNELASGESVRGYLAFEIPSDETVDRIVWSWPVFEWVNQWTWE